MMFDDEEERLRRQAAALAARQRFQPAALDGWAVAELRDYITALREEIARAESAIAAREAQRGAADALFRKP
jgi:uncharacterized small protein (DUF1192 family)